MREPATDEHVLFNKLVTAEMLELTAAEFNVLCPLAMELCLREDAPEDHDCVVKWFADVPEKKVEDYKQRFVDLGYIAIDGGTMRLGPDASIFVMKEPANV